MGVVWCVGPQLCLVYRSPCEVLKSRVAWGRNDLLSLSVDGCRSSEEVQAALSLPAQSIRARGHHLRTVPGSGCSLGLLQSTTISLVLVVEKQVVGVAPCAPSP